MKNKKDPAFTRKLISLVMPIAFQQFMLALVSASDALMLGVISQDSLSAVSLAGQITFIHNLLLEAMTIGLSLIAAQYWGKGDIPAVERIFAFVMKVTTVISLVFTLSALLIPGMLMRIFTNDPVLIRGGSLYLRVIAVSYLLTGSSQMYLCILKNSGRAAKSSMISATSVVVNIFINAVLIYGLFGMPRMEIAGAALATVTVCMGLGNGGGIMSGLVLLAFSPLILRAANLSVTAEGYLKGMLLICAYYMIGRSVNGVTISGIFCAGGDSKFGLYCDCISMWCIMVPLGLIAAFVLKLPVLAVYFIISLDEFVKIPAVYLNYKKYRWVKDLTVKTDPT